MKWAAQAEKMTEKTKASGKDKPRGAASYSIQKEGQGGSTYYVTRSENGEITDRTRVLVPDQRNLFFSRRKAETAA